MDNPPDQSLPGFTVISHTSCGPQAQGGPRRKSSLAFSLQSPTVGILRCRLHISTTIITPTPAQSILPREKSRVNKAESTSKGMFPEIKVHISTSWISSGSYSVILHIPIASLCTQRSDCQVPALWSPSLGCALARSSGCRLHLFANMTNPKPESRVRPQ